MDEEIWNSLDCVNTSFLPNRGGARQAMRNRLTDSGRFCRNRRFRQGDGMPVWPRFEGLLKSSLAQVEPRPPEMRWDRLNVVVNAF